MEGSQPQGVHFTSSGLITRPSPSPPQTDEEYARDIWDRVFAETEGDELAAFRAVVLAIRRKYGHNV